MKTLSTRIRILLLVYLTFLDVAEQESTGIQQNVTTSKGTIAYSPLTLSNPFFKVIGDHIKAEARKHGYDTLMLDPNEDVKTQSDQIDDFISKQVSAIILVPATDFPLVQRYKRLTRRAFQCSQSMLSARLRV